MTKTLADRVTALEAAVEDLRRAIAPAPRGRPKTTTPADAAEAKRLKAAGESITAIAAQLGVTRPTVYKLLAGTK